MFARFARREGIVDAALCEAVRRAEDGLIDADLGGGLIKQRIARPGGGKSRGYRSIVMFRAGDRAIFAYGFPKSARDNLRLDELRAYREAARELFGYSGAAIRKAVEKGVLEEVNWDGEQ